MYDIPWSDHTHCHWSRCLASRLSPAHFSITIYYARLQFPDHETVHGTPLAYSALQRIDCHNLRLVTTTNSDSQEHILLQMVLQTESVPLQHMVLRCSQSLELSISSHNKQTRHSMVTHLLIVRRVTFDLLQDLVLWNSSCNARQAALSTGVVVVLGPQHQPLHHHHIHRHKNSRHMEAGEGNLNLTALQRSVGAALGCDSCGLTCCRGRELTVCTTLQGGNKKDCGAPATGMRAAVYQPDLCVEGAAFT